MKATRDERFESLYWAHHRDLLAFIRRRTSPESAEDVLAEVFVVVWRRIDEIPEYERAWLFTVARNTIGTHLRAQNRRWALHVRMAIEPPPAQQDLSAAIATRADLVEAWNRLTDSEQEVIALVAWDELSQNDAALVLGITKSAFAVRLFRARRRLLHLLERTSSNRPRRPGEKQTERSQR